MKTLTLEVLGEIQKNYNMPILSIDDLISKLKYLQLQEHDIKKGSSTDLKLTIIYNKTDNKEDFRGTVQESTVTNDYEYSKSIQIMTNAAVLSYLTGYKKMEFDDAMRMKKELL